MFSEHCSVNIVYHRRAQAKLEFAVLASKLNLNFLHIPQNLAVYIRSYLNKNEILPGSSM